MKRPPPISVLLPFRGHQAYIGQAVHSLQAQTWADFEAVLV